MLTSTENFEKLSKKLFKMSSVAVYRWIVCKLAAPINTPPLIIARINLIKTSDWLKTSTYSCLLSLTVYATHQMKCFFTLATFSVHLLFLLSSLSASVKLSTIFICLNLVTRKYFSFSLSLLRAKCLNLLQGCLLFLFFSSLSFHSSLSVGGGSK